MYILIGFVKELLKINSFFVSPIDDFRNQYLKIIAIGYFKNIFHRNFVARVW